LPGDAQSIIFDFSNDPKLKEAHWARDKNICDILIHLFEWHQLLLKWIEANLSGESKPFLPQPYNWKTYGDMNIRFFEKHQATSYEDANSMLHATHNKVIELIETFTDEELFTKKYY